MCCTVPAHQLSQCLWSLKPLLRLSHPASKPSGYLCLAELGREWIPGWYGLCPGWEASIHCNSPPLYGQQFGLEATSCSYTIVERIIGNEHLNSFRRLAVWSLMIAPLSRIQGVLRHLTFAEMSNRYVMSLPGISSLQYSEQMFASKDQWEDDRSTTRGEYRNFWPSCFVLESMRCINWQRTLQLILTWHNVCYNLIQSVTPWW